MPDRPSSLPRRGALLSIIFVICAWPWFASSSSLIRGAFVPRRVATLGGSLTFFQTSRASATPASLIPPPEAIGAALRPGGPKLGKDCTSWDVLDKSTLGGKTAVVTGANCGIGYHTALALAYGGADVYLACRDRSKADDARAAMAAAFEAAGVSKYSLHTAELDLASLRSVFRFADDWKKSGRPLNLLCLNAGVMAIPDYRTSVDGIEMTMATNHLGHFALTTALQDTLESSGQARVVTLSSEAHRAPNRPLDVNDLPPSKEKYNDWGSYQQSKLANALFSDELARRLQERGSAITSNAVHPGVIRTDLGRQQFLKGRALLAAFQDRNEEQGAATSVYCLSAKNLEGVTGKYFRDCAQAEPSEFAQDAEAARRLWQWSEQVVDKYRKNVA